MDNSDTEVICVKCEFYTDKFFAHKHKDGKFYCSQCYSKELEILNMTKNIKSTINNRKEFLDKNRNNYLILELENGESILVFNGKVNQERWSWLEEGKEINFTVEEGKNGANLLTDFVIEV